MNLVDVFDIIKHVSEGTRDHTLAFCNTQICFDLCVTKAPFLNKSWLCMDNKTDGFFIEKIFRIFIELLIN